MRKLGNRLVFLYFIYTPSEKIIHFVIYDALFTYFAKYLGNLNFAKNVTIILHPTDKIVHAQVGLLVA